LLGNAQFCVWSWWVVWWWAWSAMRWYVGYRRFGRSIAQAPAGFLPDSRVTQCRMTRAQAEVEGHHHQWLASKIHVLDS
jgi:hypothetical protein